MDEIAPSLAIEDVVKMTSAAEREKSPEPPTPDQTAIGGRTLAIESVEIDFIGKSSHAGLAPEDGINALDAACAFYQMVNIQKQYYPETNVHGVILETGKKASVIPDFTSLHYLNRAWDMQSIHALKKMMVDCAEAAARMTGCKVEIRPIETNNAAMLSNPTPFEAPAEAD